MKTDLFNDELSKFSYNPTPLYPLPIIDGENLSSYICRLAIAHNVTTVTLIQYYLVPGLMNYKDRHLSVYKGNAYRINGFGNLTRETISILEKLTSVKDIRKLTLINLEKCVSRHKLLKPSKVWCPKCLNDMLKNEVPIHEKLIWCISDVKMCNIHNVELKDVCFNCSKKQVYFRSGSLIGYCDFCHCWLGGDRTLSLSLSNYDVQVSKEVTKLLEYIGENEIELKNLLCSLEKVKKYYIPTPYKYFCKNTLKISSGSFNRYLSNKSFPTLSIFLKLSGIFDIPLIDILTDNIRVESRRDGIHSYSKTFKDNSKKRINKNGVKLKLKYIIENEKKFVNKNDLENRVGCSVVTLKHYFPDLYSEFVRVNRFNKKNFTLKINLERRKIIRRVVIELYNSGVYPSQRLVASRVPFSFHSKNNDLMKTWRETIRELNILMRSN